MTKDDFIEFELNGSFLKNSGILGLLRLLKYKESEAVKNVDYVLEGNSLKVSKDYFLSHNIGKLYISAMVYYLGENTKFTNVMSKKDKIDSLIQKESMTKDEDKDLKGLINEFGDMLLKPSFIAGYEIINKYTGSIAPEVSKIKEMKEEKDLEKKHSLYAEIYKTLEDKEVQKILIFKDIMYNKINMFISDKRIFYQASKLRLDMADCYNEELINPIINEINAKKKGKKVCIECRNSYNHETPISFVNQTDDVGKKKSHYWNQNVDAYACQYCTFLYSLVPLGFYFTGKNAVFINISSNVAALEEWMNKYFNPIKKNDDISEKCKIYRIFTSEAASMVTDGVHNIQVVTKMKDVSEYDIKVISKDIVEEFDEVQKNVQGKEGILTILEKIWVKTNHEFIGGYRATGDKKKSEFCINVYDMVMDCIINRKSLYYVFDGILSNALSDGSNANYLKYVLKLQLIFGGEKKMKDDLLKKTEIAYAHGIEVRPKISTVKLEKKDNMLRGIIYKLESSITTGSVDEFHRTIIRIYSSFGIPVPRIFMEIQKSREYFNAIGRSYILGLMYEKYEKKDDKQEDKKDE